MSGTQNYHAEVNVLTDSGDFQTFYNDSPGATPAEALNKAKATTQNLEPSGEIAGHRTWADR